MSNPASPTNKMRMKIGVMAVILCVVSSSALIGRLFYLQIISGEKYKQMAIDQQLRDTTIQPHRGSIYDTNMDTLAQSATVWNIVFEPHNLPTGEKQREAILKTLSEGLAPILGIPGKEFYDRSGEDASPYWEVLSKKVDKDIADKVTAFVKKNDIDCIKLEQDTKRYYPYGDLASTVLGFVNSDNNGAYGLESYYNKILTGTEGRVVSAKNGMNSDMPFKYQKLYESQDGNSLVLTIDETIQHFVEKHLEIAVNEHEVKKRAIAIVMRPKTGEILAMSTKPDFDPNDPRVITDPLCETRLHAALEKKKRDDQKAAAEKQKAAVDEANTQPSVDANGQPIVDANGQPINAAPAVTAPTPEVVQPIAPVVTQGPQALIASTTVNGKTSVDVDVLKSIATAGGMNEEEFSKWLMDERNSQWRNKCISDPYEPGSVFKLITSAAALDTDSQTLENQYYCIGFKEVAGRKIKCWKGDGGHGPQNFTEAVMHSCNPAFIEIGQAIGTENFLNYFDRFGLTEITGIDLPGEAEGLHFTEETMNLSELSSSAFGQTFKVTPLQLITGISASLNGGDLVQPYVVKQIIDADKNIVESYSPQIKRQVISKETSEKVRKLGEAVVSGGEGASGRNAAIPGYRVGGKTGTSEKLDNFDENRVQYGNVLSFLGFAPADDPEVAVLVALDEPVVGNAQSSTIAAPVVGAMLEDILPYLGFEPSYTAEELANQKDIKVKNYLNLKPHEAQGEIRKLGLKTEIIGKGTTVLKQIPAEGKTLPYGGTVILYSDENEANAIGTIPDTIGKTAFEANQLITNAGFNVNIEGEETAEGKPKTVVTQNPPAGSTAETGSIVTISFKAAVEETAPTAATADTPQTAPAGQPTD